MQTRRWVATINNPTPNDNPKTWDVAFVTGQKEKGGGGTEHYQLYVELRKKQRLSYMKKINNRAHWDGARGTQKQCIDYVTKKDTRIEEPFECGTKMRTNADGSTGRGRNDLDEACAAAEEGSMDKIREEFPKAAVMYGSGMRALCLYHHHKKKAAISVQKFLKAELRDWQQELTTELLEVPHPRKIIWMYEAEGNTGKTFLGNYLKAIHGACLLDCGKKVENAYLLREHTGRITIFNMTRTISDDMMNHVYELAERVKDNTVVSTKYETQRVELSPQQVVVFANREPDYTKWSKDRYDVRNIGPIKPIPVVSPPKKKLRIA